MRALTPRDEADRLQAALQAAFERLCAAKRVCDGAARARHVAIAEAEIADLAARVGALEAAHPETRYSREFGSVR